MPNFAVVEFRSISVPAASAESLKGGVSEASVEKGLEGGVKGGGPFHRMHCIFLIASVLPFQEAHEVIE